MWYRLIKKAVVEVLDKPLITKHKTKGRYGVPVWDITTENDFTSSLGTGSKAFGPGHYTSLNPEVTKGYEGRYTRLEVLPAGTRILEAIHVPKADYQKIIDKLIEMDLMEEEKRNLFKDDFIGLDSLVSNMTNAYLLNSVLLSLGYDAVKYPAFTRWNLPKRLGESDEEYKNRVNRVKAMGENILILNRALLSVPKLFEKSRFNPESLTDKEIDKLQSEMYLSEIDILKMMGKESFFFTSPSYYDFYLRTLSKDEILDMLRSIPNDQFCLILRNVNKNGNKYLQLLSDDEILDRMRSFSEDQMFILFEGNSEYLKLLSDDEIKNIIESFSDEKILNLIFINYELLQSIPKDKILNILNSSSNETKYKLFNNYNSKLELIPDDLMLNIIRSFSNDQMFDIVKNSNDFIDKYLNLLPENEIYRITKSFSSDQKFEIFFSYRRNLKYISTNDRLDFLMSLDHESLYYALKYGNTYGLEKHEIIELIKKLPSDLIIKLLSQSFIYLIKDFDKTWLKSIFNEALSKDIKFAEYLKFGKYFFKDLNLFTKQEYKEIMEKYSESLKEEHKD